MDWYVQSGACLSPLSLALYSVSQLSRKIPAGRLSHTALPSPSPAGFTVQKGNDLLQLLFCHSHHFVIWVPSNSALSYMINSCHMWLVLSDPLCRGMVWAFAREKETYVGFKTCVQMNKKDWSQIFVGWLTSFLKLFISYDEEFRNSYKRYFYHIGNSCLFIPWNSLES